MTNEAKDSHESAGVDDVRNELKSELLRAARMREVRRHSWWRRLGFSVAAVVTVAIPGTLAVAGLMPDGDDVSLRSEPFQPAPPPLFAPAGPYADCPQEVQEMVIELELSEYAESPGYPVAGCPTVEAIEETRSPGVVSLEPLLAPGGPFDDCPPEVLEYVRELEDLSEYASTPGYPVAGCPTVEMIEELLPTIERIEGGATPLQDLRSEEGLRLAPER